MSKYIIFMALMVVALLKSGELYALEIKPVTDNGTTIATISSNDLTKIMIKGDRIYKIYGNKGVYTLEKNPDLGVIYIRPTSNYSHAAFTILIDTELKQHYTLLLNPMSVPSDTLLLVPTGVIANAAAHVEQSSPYEISLINIIDSISNGNTPEGFANHLAFKRNFIIGDVTISAKKNYQGNHVRAEIWQLSNNSNKNITLSERDFYKPGTLAISFINTNINPHGETTMIRIVNHAE